MPVTLSPSSVASLLWNGNRRPEAPSTKPLAAGELPGGRPDAAYDGALIGVQGRAFRSGTPLGSVPAVHPRSGPARGTTLYLNGILTDRALQADDMQAIADRTGMAVVGIHNATQGIAADVAQSSGDKLNRLQDFWGGRFDALLGANAGSGPAAPRTVDLAQNPATRTTAELVYLAVKRGEPVHVLAHSQGAIILSDALATVRSRLVKSDGLSVAQAEALLAKVEVETFGGAAHTYPDGPRYVHYLNRFDAVADTLGLEAFPSPGRGAVIREFADVTSGAPLTFSRHLVPAYLAHRVAFDEARRGGDGR